MDDTSRVTKARFVAAAYPVAILLFFKQIRTLYAWVKTIDLWMRVVAALLQLAANAMVITYFTVLISTYTDYFKNRRGFSAVHYLIRGLRAWLENIAYTVFAIGLVMATATFNAHVRELVSVFLNNLSQVADGISMLLAILAFVTQVCAGVEIELLIILTDE